MAIQMNFLCCVLKDVECKGSGEVDQGAWMNGQAGCCRDPLPLQVHTNTFATETQHHFITDV